MDTENAPPPGFESLKLDLLSVDGRPLPARIRSGYGGTTIVSGYANRMYNGGTNWVISAATPDGQSTVQATGTKAKPIRKEEQFSFTFGANGGGVFGPDDHTYQFGRKE